MGTVNQVTLFGRLGADPELRFIPSGRAVCNFNIATEEVWKDNQGQNQKSVDWHRIVVWGPQAEAAGKYLAKGREVLILGRLQTRSYDDKDGQKRYVTEVIARSVVFAGGGGGGGSQPAAGPAPGPAPGASSGGGGGFPVPTDDDVPF